MKNLPILLITFLLLGCKELQTTQKTVKFTLDSNTLTANGQDWAKITITFDNLIEEDQEIIVRTTQGSLYEAPTNNINTPSLNEITFEPRLWGTRNRDQAIVFLRSDNTPSDEVYVSVQVNRLFKQEQVMFVEEPISTILLQAQSFEMTQSANDEITLDIVLLSDSGTPSIGGRLNQSITFEDQDGNPISEPLLVFESVISISNDTLQTKLAPRNNGFNDPAITEVSALITITDPVSGATATETIKIL